MMMMHIDGDLEEGLVGVGAEDRIESVQGVADLVHGALHGHLEVTCT